MRPERHPARLCPLSETHLHSVNLYMFYSSQAAALDPKIKCLALSGQIGKHQYELRLDRIPSKKAEEIRPYIIDFLPAKRMKSGVLFPNRDDPFHLIENSVSRGVSDLQLLNQLVILPLHPVDRSVPAGDTHLFDVVFGSSKIMKVDPRNSLQAQGNNLRTDKSFFLNRNGPIIAFERIKIGDIQFIRTQTPV